jgi:type IV pilus assembly protein PilC
MAAYNFTARDPATGKKIKNTMVADNQETVVKNVTAQGYTILEISPVNKDGVFSSLKNRVKSKDKVIFSRQLATLIDAGLPLVQSLRSVQKQTKNKTLQTIIAEIINKVEGGKQFSDSLKEYPKIFNQVFVSLVAAGEASGTLDVALERIANQQEKDAEIINKVRGALVYPLVVLFVMGLVVGFMIVGVLPQVKTLYEGIGTGAQLPFITRALLALSDFVINYWWLLIIIIIVMIGFTTRWARTLGGKTAIDTLKMRTPAIGRLFMKVYMARFSRTSTTLVASGVPLLQVLDITAQAISNVHIENSILRAAEKVKGGKALSEALMGDENFLELVPQMIKIGEDSGAIEQMLEKTATYYEKEVDEEIKTISTIIEPALMIILGIVAITIVVAILLPIYSLVGKNVI